MEKTDILQKYDLTLLKPTARAEDITALCDKAVQLGCASVCVPPCYVEQAHDYLKGRLPVCTVIGFPLGYGGLQGKVEEARAALLAGADELDMVINICRLKDGDYAAVEKEIRAVKKRMHADDVRCGGFRHFPRVLKVIVETCLLTEEEKKKVCEIVARSGADFIKTSTGFSTGGATVEDVELFRRELPPEIKIKASGGIHTREQAEALILAGADRIGASNAAWAE